MPAFLEDITPFLGTGEKNEDGLTLAEFLEEYDPYHYKNPSVTADILVFLCPKELFSNGTTDIRNQLKILMVKRRNHPSIGCWALPGGFVNVEEDLETAAKRELEEETGLTGIDIEMVTTYGEADRDPRGRIITSSFVALVDKSATKVQAGDDAEDAAYVDVHMMKTGELVENRDGKEKRIETFSLHLSCEDKEIDLHATVERSVNAKGILKEEHFRVTENDGIAFDHPRFIVQSLLYIEGLL